MKELEKGLKRGIPVEQTQEEKVTLKYLKKDEKKARE